MKVRLIVAIFILLAALPALAQEGSNDSKTFAFVRAVEALRLPDAKHAALYAQEDFAFDPRVMRAFLDAFMPNIENGPLGGPAMQRVYSAVFACSTQSETLMRVTYHETTGGKFPDLFVTCDTQELAEALRTDFTVRFEDGSQLTWETDLSGGAEAFLCFNTHPNTPRSFEPGGMHACLKLAPTTFDGVG